MRYSQLEEIILECKPTSIIEIGTHHGRRAYNMCVAALEMTETLHYIGFDLWGDATPETDKREMNGKGAGSERKALRAMKLINILHPGFTFELHKGDTRESLHGKNLVADLVFIDGGHSVETIRGDYEAVKGSKVIVFDDYYVSGADTTKFGCNEVVKDLPHELLPKVDRFGELAVQMVKIEHKHRCTICGKFYSYGPKGHVTMPWCTECVEKPAPPNPYIVQNGILVRNTEVPYA